jgi:hypothetical protein
MGGWLPAFQTVRVVLEGLIWPFSLAFGSSPRLRMHDCRTSQAGARGGLRPQFRNEPQNLLEHLSWDGDLSHLEDNIAAGAHNLRTDLDQFLFKLVSDQSLIGSGIARVRRKLPRL